VKAQVEITEEEKPRQIKDSKELCLACGDTTTTQNSVLV